MRALALLSKLNKKIKKQNNLYFLQSDFFLLYFHRNHKALVPLKSEMLHKEHHKYDVNENYPIFRIPHPLVHLRPKFLHPLTLDVQLQTNPTLLSKWWPIMLSGSSLRFGLPLTCFYLAEISLSAFSCFSCVHLSKSIAKYILFIIIRIFVIHFAINLFYFLNLKT